MQALENYAALQRIRAFSFVPVVDMRRGRCWIDEDDQFTRIATPSSDTAQLPTVLGLNNFLPCVPASNKIVQGEQEDHSAEFVAHLSEISLSARGQTFQNNWNVNHAWLDCDTTKDQICLHLSAWMADLRPTMQM